jgi:ATP-binding cassette subfamily G (WHITE) protein 2 (PDR)
MEKLTRSGQAILCTIHQPSAILFQRFDRLLLLAKGGKTVYFGDIGKNSRVLIDYFVRNGAAECPLNANPAEYMLEVIGSAPGAHTEIDWASLWRQTPEYREVHSELERLSTPSTLNPDTSVTNASAYDEFAAPYSIQFVEVTKRVFKDYWRSPSYIYFKAMISVGSVCNYRALHLPRSKLSLIGIANRVFPPQFKQHFSWASKPNVWCLDVPHDLSADGKSNYADVYIAADVV